MKKNTTKKLLNYGAMSAALLGVANAAGQIVYVDITDENLVTGDAFPMDLDGDAVNDFSVDIFDAAGGAGAVVFPGINGSVNSNGMVAFSASGFTYPLNLSSGVAIDAGASFVSSNRGDLNFYSCAYANSQWCGGTTDGYLGIQFKISGNTHYGWIRLDVSADATAVTVKDYAYNSTPDAAINAGQQTLGVDDNAFNGFTFFVDASNQLNISANVPMENVQLFNILGQNVLSQKLSNTNEVITISSLKSGVYIATVLIEGQSKSFKIVKR